MQHQIVSREQWTAAREQLLKQEKELTRLRDQVSARRRELPWVKVEKNYVFDGPDGKATLADLFEGRGQLVVRHFMFGPEWEEGCVGCSFAADHLDGALVHLEHHDVTVVVVSRAPLAKIEAFRRRMGWRFRWVSSFESDFNYDYHVSFTPEQVAAGDVSYNYTRTARAGEEMPGTSVFYKTADGTIVHTYSAYARGNEPMLGTYSILDLTPNGRNETGLNGNLTDWVRLHDRYDAVGAAESCCAAEQSVIASG
jgi:predicted dithiol-disulfide oxidoreductase (DUF899 family)